VPSASCQRPEKVVSLFDFFFDVLDALDNGSKNDSLNSLSALALSIALMKSSQDDNEQEDAGT